jgi:hypothetical protein
MELAAQNGVVSRENLDLGELLFAECSGRFGLMRDVSVHLTELAREAIAGKDPDLDRVAEGVGQAIGCYMAAKGSSGSGWAYPSFLPGEESADGIEVRLSVDEDLWRSLEEEADEQEVPLPRMVVHATLWFAAELEAGRVTRPIVEDDLDDVADEKLAPS